MAQIPNRIIQIVIRGDDIIGLDVVGDIYIRREWEHGYKWKLLPTDIFDLED